MTIFNALPYTLTNGTTADATQVMADYNQILNDGNANAAHNGANSDITSLSGLTTPLSYAQGGTAANTSIPVTPWAVAGGTADAITVTYSPVNTSLFDGLVLGFRATAANATTTPTFKPDSLTAHTITKFGGSALVAGDIPGALAECVVRYNAANTRWELTDPAPPGTAVTSIADATNGGLNFSAATGAVTANLKPSDLVVKSAPTSADSVFIMDAAATNAAKTSPLGTVGPIVVPRGRLTLVTATPVMTTTQSAKTSVFYTPYLGNGVPVYDGTGWANRTFAELTLALDSNSGHTGYQQSGKLFDLFVVSNAGTVTLVSGPAWTSSTGRGAGAGTTELTRVNGFLVNANQMTAKFDASASTLTITANLATYLGTMLASADGQTQWIYGALAASGTAAGFNLWNYFNRVIASTFVEDTTDSWTYTTATWRSANNSATMRAAFVQGVAEDSFQARYNVYSSNSGNGVIVRQCGVGYDATNALAAGCSPGFANMAVFTDGGGGSATPIMQMTAAFVKVADLGSHFIQALEISTASGTTTWYSDNGAPTTTQNGLFFSGTF